MTDIGATGEAGVHVPRLAMKEREKGAEHVTTPSQKMGVYLAKGMPRKKMYADCKGALKVNMLIWAVVWWYSVIAITGGIASLKHSSFKVNFLPDNEQISSIFFLSFSSLNEK